MFLDFLHEGIFFSFANSSTHLKNTSKQCYYHFLFLCYSPTKETNRRLTVDEMYLVDSGGQYL